MHPLDANSSQLAGVVSGRAVVGGACTYREKPMPPLEQPVTRTTGLLVDMAEAIEEAVGRLLQERVYKYEF